MFSIGDLSGIASGSARLPPQDIPHLAILSTRGGQKDSGWQIVNCDAQLQRLGTHRATVDDQRRYLFQVSRDYPLLMQAAVYSEYSHQFFGSAKSDEGSRRRLRARVQNILDDFAEDMRVHGQTRVLLDEVPEDEEIGVCSRYILRSDYIEEVKNLMKKSRGRKLSGTFNPLIISELFKGQCKPWQGLVDKVREQVLHAIDKVTNAIVTHVAAGDTVPGILSILRNARTNSIRDLDARFETLLEPHLNGHPITYSHYMTDNGLEKAFRDLVGAENFKKGKKVALYPHEMFTELKRRTEVGMQLYAGQPATDYMEAYSTTRCVTPSLATGAETDNRNEGVADSSSSEYPSDAVQSDGEIAEKFTTVEEPPPSKARACTSTMSATGFAETNPCIA
ncbi:dynamin GTPase [Beauveria bassiana ARSEF 2860]|uniref:Dynamin GTPase n=1 Tax=Beauveria bassiana (strain ARSEF 2860) TaxID=655819 RepID=J4KKW0_BEAB2|nr:dynamin GTPase [Beauveria bassiana ARSEF 2860]EJP61139.1 dynamin GTPase [Beauveria bassiana ARSEF 2860]